MLLTTLQGQLLQPAQPLKVTLEMEPCRAFMTHKPSVLFFGIPYSVRASTTACS